MKEKQYLSNKSALEFNRSKNEEMKKICSPLEEFELSNFVYTRFFNGGKRFYISNNLSWVELYIKNNLQDVAEHTEYYAPPNEIRYAFWPNSKRDKVYDAGAELNLGNGFSIYEKHNGYIDCFDFSSNDKNTQLNNFYLNNLAILELFIKDFKEKTTGIIDYTDDSKLIVPTNEIFFSDIKYSSFIDEKDIKNFMEQTQIQLHLNS